MRIQLKDIRPNPNNPRVKRGDDFKRLKTSLAQFPQMLLVRGLGVVQNSDGTWTVLGGNQRRGGLVELEKEFGRPAFDKYGADEKAREILEDYFNNGIPCEDCTNFNEEQRQRFVIADNLNYADWDMEAVRAGWTADEIGQWGTGDLFDAWGAESGGKNIEEDGFEMPDENTIVTDIKLGDLFEIGPHRLLCGDSTDKATVERLMNGVKADMVFTDPPYEIDINYGVVERFITDGHILIMNNDRRIINQISSSPFKFKGFFVFHHSGTAIPQEGGNEVFLDHVLCSHEVVGNPPVRYNKGNGTRSVIKGEYRKSDLHKHEKPFSFLSPLVSAYSNNGFVILDFFAGSGSLMAVSHQLNRTCYALEIDPKYCQVTINRILKLDPSLEVKKNGQPYN